MFARDLADSTTDIHQLPLVHDGLPLIGASPAAYAVRAAAEGLDPDRRETLRWLQQSGPKAVAILGDHFDHISSLLAALGVRYGRIASEDLAGPGPAVVFAGCPHRHTRLDEEDARGFLDRGGVLVSSCRAARLPGVAGHLPFDRPRGPRRARITTLDGATPDNGMLYPAVALDHGHVPLSHQVDDYHAATVLARDVLDDRPLVVVMSQSQGAIVHSVAHWWQNNPDALTALERQPLMRVRDLTSLANSHPDLTWGGFRAAQAMLSMLLEGIEMGTRQAQSTARGVGSEDARHEEG